MESAVAAQPVHSHAPGGGETLLVVEDEPALCQLLREVLERHGYRVLIAVDGADALEVSARYPGPIHLLLTDVAMPRLSGPEAARRLARTRPEMRCLYVSAHAQEHAGDHGPLEAGTAFLRKPFPPATLLAAVRETLDRPRRGTGHTP